MSYIKVLALKCETSYSMSYMSDWEDAFLNHKKLKVTVVNTQDQDLSLLINEIKSSDLIVGLHSFVRTPAACKIASKIAKLFDSRKGMFLTLVGDELNLHNAPMSEKLKTLECLKPDYIGTQLPIAAGQWLYSDIGSDVIPLPHALNHRYWISNTRTERQFDIASLSVRYPVYLGDNDRNRLFETFISLQSSNLTNYNFCISQSQEKRLSRGEWKELLYNSFGTISSEAGTSYLERDDHTVNNVVKFLVEKANSKGLSVVTNSKVRKIFHKLPPSFQNLIKRSLSTNGLSQYIGLDQLVFHSDFYDEVYEQFFKKYNKLPFESKALSSRHLEAIGTRTCQIMFSGHYNGVLNQDEHYISIARDLSNIREVMDKFYDPHYRTLICESALAHVMEGHTLEHRIEKILSLCR